MRAGAALRWGITQRHLPAAEGAFARDALDAAWPAWLAARGMAFVPVPNFADAETAAAYCDALGIGALLLSGGEDVGSSAPRDAVEHRLLAQAAQAGWPVLGVCRGMQLLHRAAGGTLEPVASHAARTHRVQAGSTSFAVNSWHRWAVAGTTPDYEALARAEDGTVEAMQHVRQPWLAVMWHPERAEGDTPLVDAWLAGQVERRR